MFAYIFKNGLKPNICLEWYKWPIRQDGRGELMLNLERVFVVITFTSSLQKPDLLVLLISLSIFPWLCAAALVTKPWLMLELKCYFRDAFHAYKWPPHQNSV